LKIKIKIYYKILKLLKKNNSELNEQKLETTKEVNELNEKIKALENKNNILEGKLNTINNENSELKNKIESLDICIKNLQNIMDSTQCKSIGSSFLYSSIRSAICSRKMWL